MSMFMIIHISVNINADLTSDWIRFQRTVFAQDLLRSEVLRIDTPEKLNC